MRVWRFSLYYVVTFGAYVALAAWLPKYYVDVYDQPLSRAALLTALFIFPASLLRSVGGWMSDKVGARRVMYLTFGVMLLALLGVAGIVVGVLIGLFSYARAGLVPLVAAIFPIPKIALLPLFVIWFGIDETSKYALIAFGTFTPTGVATYAAVDNVDRTLIRMGQSF